MSARRKIAGAAAHDAGEAFESDLRRGDRPANVYLCRTGPDTRMVWQDGRLTRIAEKSSEGIPDFHGTVDGVGFCFDAKSTTDVRWKLRQLKPEQAAWLSEAAGRGCSAGVLLRFDLTQRVVYLPWRILDVPWTACAAVSRAASGTASWTWEDCLSHGGVAITGLRWWDEING